MESFIGTCERIVISESKEIQKEQIAAELNGLDDLIDLQQKMKTQGNHTDREKRFYNDLERDVNKKLALADQYGIDLVGTMQNYYRARDENQVFQNVKSYNTDIRRSIYPDRAP